VAKITESRRREFNGIRSAIGRETRSVVHHDQRFDGRRELGLAVAGGVGQAGVAQATEVDGGENSEEEAAGRQVSGTAAARRLRQTFGGR